MKRIKRANGTGTIQRERNGTYTTKVHRFVDGVKKRVVLSTGHRTYKQAERFLNDYIIQPYDLDGEKLTFKELYRQFIKYKEQDNITENTLKNYNYAFKRCAELHDERIRDLTKPQIQLFINTLKQKNGKKASDGTKENTKIFIAMLLEFAKDNRLINNNVASYVMKKNNFEKVKDRNIFSAQEIQFLWDNLEIPFVDVIIIMIYTGVRIGEMRQIKLENVDLINRKILNSGNKTRQGKARSIFIKREIYELVAKRYRESPTEYLVYGTMESRIRREKPVSKSYFESQFQTVMRTLGMVHTPHDTRHTFLTRIYLSGARDKEIEMIGGHTSIKMTEKHYVHLDDEELLRTMDNLDFLN